MAADDVYLHQNAGPPGVSSGDVWLFENAGATESHSGSAAGITASSGVASGYSTRLGAIAGSTGSSGSGTGSESGSGAVSGVTLSSGFARGIPSRPTKQVGGGYLPPPTWETLHRAVGAAHGVTTTSGSATGTRSAEGTTFGATRNAGDAYGLHGQRGGADGRTTATVRVGGIALNDPGRLADRVYVRREIAGGGASGVSRSVGGATGTSSRRASAIRAANLVVGGARGRKAFEATSSVLHARVDLDEANAYAVRRRREEDELVLSGVL